MIYLIPIILVIVFGIYYVTVIPKLKKQSEQAMQTLKENLKGKETELQKKYLEDPNYLEPIAKAIKGEEIEGIATCMEKRSVGQVLKQGFVNDLTKSIKQETGINIKGMEHNQDVYYLALTNKNNLHYLIFADGKIKEHLTFNLNEIKEATVETAGALDQMIKGGQQRYEKLSFKHQGEDINLFFAKAVLYLPNRAFVGDVMAEWMILFAEPFDAKLRKALSV